ncbi:MAG: sulfate ABC transporter permease [Bacillota bacterium]
MAKTIGPSKKARRFLAVIVFLYFCILILFPVGGMFFGAFAEGWHVFWGEVSRPEAVYALQLTAIITVIVTVLNTTLGTVLAMLLVRHSFPGRSLLNGMVDLPFAVSPVIAGFMIILLYGPQGVLGLFFDRMGYQVVFALPGMVLATLFVTLPFVVREVSLVLAEMGVEEEDAAKMLGASRWHIFWKVTFPGIRWGLLYGITLTVARALGEFGAVLVVSGNVINLTQTATLHIYQDYVDYNYLGAYAVSAILAVISIVTLFGLEFLKKKKEVGEHGH